MNKPTLSVCMITYNHEKYIAEAINGVLMQVCNFEVELILANDCSTDKTDAVIQEIIQNHPNRSWIKYTNHPQNKGMMPNFIWAMQQCKGKYIALCEGDDYWTNPLKLQKQVDFLEGNLDYVLCFHQVNILKTNGEIVSDFITKVPENYETIETLARLGNYIHTPSVVFRNIIKEFPFEFKHTPIGDYFLYMMLAEKGKLKYLGVNMGVYRYGDGFFSGNSSLEKVNSNLKLFTCLGFYLKNEEIKKIILNRQLQTVNRLTNLLSNQCNGYFILNHIFFRKIKYIQTNYKNPNKILKKVITKFRK
ncbi:MAG: glycosyltransferase [Flavobacteriaceae bacterium]|nr:glycosyltransferase [Flavobacteriaceae bacterium]